MQFEKQYDAGENRDNDDRKLSENNGSFQDINEYVANIAKSEGYVSFQILQKPILSGNANFAADLLLVDIKGKTEKGKSETNLFIKKTSEKCKFLVLDDLYETELFAYKSLSKVFTDIQDGANVPIEKRYKMAKCYKESNTKTIILENAMKKGFKTLYKMDVMPLKFAELSVIELAKFHALSFVIKLNMPEYFVENLKRLRFPKLPDEVTEKTLQLSVDALNGDPCLDKLRKYLDRIKLKFIEFMSNTSSPGCCLCYGDYRVSNILAKTMEGQVVEILPVDYQTLYYGHPLQDFIGLIFLNSDQDFRRNHMTDLKNLYFDTLKHFLKYFNLDVEEVSPRVIFEKDYKERLAYGLVVSLMVLPLLFVHDDEVLDLGAEDLKLNNVDPKFNDRIRGIIYDFIDWGYL